VSTLARRTGLPNTTVHRHVHQLVDAGLLERSGDAFVPTLLLFEIGQAAARRRTLQEAARPRLSVLHDATGPPAGAQPPLPYSPSPPASWS
jgi:DNA-binding IclR family transcriptional regulator